jgi:hypothetical protein
MAVYVGEEWKYSSTNSWPRHQMDVSGQFNPHRPIYPWEKSPLQPPNCRLGRSQKRSGCCEVQKKGEK